MENQTEKYEYKIKEQKDDPYECLILKEGLTAEFTLNDVKKDIEVLNKRKTELEAKKKIPAALIENVKKEYAEVIEKTDEKSRIAIFIYEKAMMEIKGAQELIDMVDKQLDSYGAEIDDICQKTGLKLDVKKDDA